MKRRYFRWGMYGVLALLLISVVAIVADIALSYDGKCGGWMPFLAGPRPCSFWEYLSDGIQLTVLVVWYAYWPFVLALLALPPIIGYVLDRRR